MAADLVALGSSGEPVGDEDRGAPPGELVEGGQHFGLSHAVQAAGGLIAQQDAGPVAATGASARRWPAKERKNRKSATCSVSEAATAGSLWAGCLAPIQ